jgi:glycosyltransferase involved in cell wall biosynthesis
MTGFKKIKILLLAPLKATGGIASWTHRLLNFPDHNGIQYEVIDTSKLFDPLGKALGIRGAILGLRDAIARMFKVFYAIIKYRPNIVYITSSPSIGLFVRDIPLMFLLKFLGVRCISHLRGGKLEGFMGRNPVRRVITKWGFKTCTAVFVITRDVEKYARLEFGSQKVFYIPNMIEDEFVSSKPEKKIYSIEEKPVMNLVHVAWQAPEKGSMELVEAIGYVKIPVCCKLIGQVAPEHLATLKQMIEEHHLENKVFITGIQKGESLDRLYKEADILVFPTHFEGFPNVIVEAMAYGLPIITTNVGNIREMIGYDTESPAGLLLEKQPPVEPVELAKKIDNILQDVQLRQQMSINGQKRVKEKYLASKVIPNLESLLVELVIAKPTPQSINYIFEQQYL